MNGENKRPRISKPSEHRDENRRSKTPNFENRDGEERRNRFSGDRERREQGSEGERRTNRFSSDRPNREQGYGFIRDLNKERAQEQAGESGNRDNNNRYQRDTDRSREREDRGNRFDNRDNNRDNRKPFERRERDGNRFPDRGERGERPFQNRERDNRQEGGFRREGERREGGFRRDDRQEGGFRREGNRQEGGFRREGGERREGGFRGDRDRQEGGFRREGNRQEGGFRREGGERREGGFRGDRDRQEGGFRREGNRQEGGFRREGGERRESGFRRDDRQEGGFRGAREDRREGDDRRERFTDSDRPVRKSFTPRAEGDGAQRSVYSKKKQIEYRKKNEGNETELRLNRYIAKGGICSRRDADELIVAGRVKVNGEVVQQVGVKVNRTDRVEVDENVITPERRVYLVLNKPKDYVTTVEDPLERRTVMSLIEGACKERVYPVGRLDRQTTGVLLFTNDGDLAKKLTHPKYNQKKIYHVFLDKVAQPGDLEAIQNGIELEDGFVQADDVRVSEEDRTQVGIEIHSGKNRIVRRMFEHLGYQILRLDRVFFAGITKKNLPRGHWRFLTQEEISVLKAY